MPTVSIIIPIYNVEPYIRQCLQSVIEQTLTEGIECLLVDDCGQDKSMDIAQQIVGEHKGKIDFRIIHHEKNRGLSAARNTGIREAKGEWLYFLDSDDWIVSECIELMTTQVNKIPDVDMVIGRVNTNSKESLPWLKFLPEGIYSEDFIEKTYFQNIFVMAWNKLVSKNFIIENGLYFKEGMKHEDVLWSMEVACKLSKVVAVKQYTYNYNIRQGSIQSSETISEFNNNCAMIKISLLKYIFNNNCHNNCYLYKYINESLYEKIVDSNIMHGLFYKEFRECKYWTPYQQKMFGAGSLTLLLSLNRYMPIIIGYNFIKSILYLYNLVFKWSQRHK